MLKPSASRRGFTLVEIIVVAALIALLSGIAIFAINEMYNRNIRKITLGETFQLASALSFAEQDLRFFPKLNYLDKSPNRLFLDETGNALGNEQVLPFLDGLGHLDPGRSAAKFIAINRGWTGPYMGVSQTRNRSNRGGISGIVKMRLADLAASGQNMVNGVDISLVDWPADVYGTPYMHYQMKSIVQNGVLQPLFIEDATEEPDFLNAVVSHGDNKIPGGNEMTDAALTEELLEGALFIEGDMQGFTGAQFTLKSFSPDVPADLRLDNNTAGELGDVLATLRRLNPDSTTGNVGMLDEGTDDIVLKF